MIQKVDRSLIANLQMGILAVLLSACGMSQSSIEADSDEDNTETFISKNKSEESDDSESLTSQDGENQSEVDSGVDAVLSFSTFAPSSNQTKFFDLCAPQQMTGQSVDVSWPKVSGAASGNIIVAYSVSCASGPGGTIQGNFATGGAGSVGLSFNLSAFNVCNQSNGSIQIQLTIINGTTMPISSALAELDC